MQRGFRWFLASALVMSLSACSTMKGWFEFDDEEDPKQPAELIDIEDTVEIDKLWSQGVGDGQGEGFYKIQPVIGGSNIYVAASDGSLEAFDKRSGKSLWDVELEFPLSGGVGVYADALFLGSSDGFVIKVDASSGEVLWSTRLSGEVMSVPQSNGAMVVVHSLDGKLQGLDFATGEVVWTYDSTVPALTLRGSGSPLVSGDTVYVGFANGRVLAFDIATGSISWEARIAIPQGRSEIERVVDIDGTMALEGEELFVASYQGRLAALNVSDGSKLWQYDVSSFSGVSQGFNNIYVADEDGTVYAYQRTGQGERWQQGALAYRGLSRPTTVGSYVAVGDKEGYVHFMSQADGEFVGRVEADGDGLRADMVSEDNIIYVYGNSGDLIAYEIKPRD
ncbi:MAG: outer membrane protein assembly factor BamB [Halioglobus sp.]|nr:outer membrane protein assembly factor BamB [Halioglobus sp.]MBP6723974.1 outer membrane protein assembly factor BamB [Halioglobus sp.]